MKKMLLIVDDEKNTREGLRTALEDNFDIYIAADADQALELMDEFKFDVVLTDFRMAGKSGLSVVDYCNYKPYKPICIMMTAYGNVETAVEAMKHGAFDFLTKPIHLEKLELLIKKALKDRQTKLENTFSQKPIDTIYTAKDFIGESKAFDNIIQQVHKVAPSKATVLITGPTGTGKERIAHLLHQNSPRAKNNFVTVHCSALPSHLLESELFGHEKGAFTGANEKRVGRFELAHNGTLFLDEIGEIEPAVQVKLLRFLENKTFERIGSNKPITVDTRLICATHRNLEEMVQKGEFREDLLYRLSVISIHLPSLKERKEDIPLLLNYYNNYFAKENHLQPVQFDSDLIETLRSYPWPGNIRELRNFCENRVVLNHGKLIKVEDLEPKFRVKSIGQSNTLSLKQNTDKILKEALVKTKGNKSQAAKLMGISRRTLHRKLNQPEN